MLRKEMNYIHVVKSDDFELSCSDDDDDDEILVS